MVTRGPEPRREHCEPKDIYLEASREVDTRAWKQRLFDPLRDFHFPGDDLEPGPIFSYARVWSNMNVLAYMVEAFSCSIIHQTVKQTVSGKLWNARTMNPISKENHTKCQNISTLDTETLRIFWCGRSTSPVRREIPQTQLSWRLPCFGVLQGQGC